MKLRCYYLNRDGRDWSSYFQEFRDGIYRHRDTGHLYRWRSFALAEICGFEIMPPLSYGNLMGILEAGQRREYDEDDLLGARLAIQEDYAKR